MTQTLNSPAFAAAAAPATTPSSLRRAGGIAGILGAVVMTASAGVMYATGADIFTAVADRDLAGYLVEADPHRTVLYAHLAMWIAGAALMSLAVALITAGSRPGIAAVIARFSATAGTGAVLVFFPMMGGVIYAFAGNPEQAEVATGLASAAVNADLITTWMIVGVGATLAALAGRGTWAPEWLLRIAMANAVVATAYLIPVSPIDTITSNLLVMTGQLTLVATGIVALRDRTPQDAR